MQAREAFLTSASQIVMPVVRIDGRPVGNGAPGLVSSGAAAGFPSLMPSFPDGFGRPQLAGVFSIVLARVIGAAI